MVNRRSNRSSHDEGFDFDEEDVASENLLTVKMRKLNGRVDACKRTSTPISKKTPWITTVKRMASKANGPEEMKKNGLEGNNSLEKNGPGEKNSLQKNGPEEKNSLEKNGPGEKNLLEKNASGENYSSEKIGPEGNSSSTNSARGKNSLQISEIVCNNDGSTSNHELPVISFPVDGMEGFVDEDGGPVSITTMTSVSPSGDTMRTTMATKTSSTSRVSEENGKRVTQKNIRRVMVGHQRIVSPVTTYIDGEPVSYTSDGSVDLFESLQPRTGSQSSSEAMLSVALPPRPASHYGLNRYLPISDPGLGQRCGSDDGDHRLNELDLAIQETLQKTMENFQRMVEKEREQLLRLFPQLANSRLAVADRAPATEIITERRVDPDGSVVEVQRVVTRQMVRVHKSVSMVNGIVKDSVARAIVEYQGPGGGYRVKLEDNDANVEVNSETEEDDDVDRASIAPSEISDTVSVIAVPGRKRSSIRKSSSQAVAIRGGDVVPSLQTSPKRRTEKAWYAALELVESERRYVEKLHLLDQVFRARVQQDPETTKTIGDDKLKKLFCNIGQLYSFHNDHLLPQLEERLGEWQTVQKVCDVVRRLAPFLKIYSDFTSNYKKAIKTFEELRKRNKRFAAIIEQIEKLPECDHLPLSNHIICPIQRVTRYHLLMTEYLKNLQDDHPDKADTTQALELTKEAAAHANNMMRQLDKYKNVIEVQELLGSQIHELLTPSRELIKQGQLMKISSRTGEHQQRYVFLFNDMLLLCSARRNVVMSAWGNKYKLRAIFEVSTMHVLEGDNLEVENTFYVRSGNKTVELYASSTKEKTEWMETLWSVIQDHHKRMRSFRKKETIEDVTSDSAPEHKQQNETCPEQKTERESPEKSQSEKARLEKPTSGRCPICSSSFKAFRKPRTCASCGINYCKKCCPKKKSDGKDQRLCRTCSEKSVKSAPLADGDPTTPTPSATESPERHSSTSPVSTSSMADKTSAVNGGTISSQRISRKSILEVKPADSCIISGTLHLRLANRKWEERYFALHEDFVLYCFKSEKDVSARTSMPISGCRISLVDQRPDSTSKDANVFKVEHNRRVYHFKAPTSQEMARWVAAVDLASEALFARQGE